MSVLTNHKTGMAWLLFSKIMAALIIFAIFMVILINSYDALYTINTNFLTVKWNPSKNLYGILPMLYGSFAVTFLSLLIAVPLGLSSAIYVSEILSPEYRIYVKSFIELLAGIPSIIYGLIGVAFLSVWVADLFHLNFGRTIFTASIILSIMILPTIMTLCEDALRHVPQKYREAAYATGLTKYETIFSAVIPIAKQNIIGAVLLAMGRAIGETMAVMLVIGSIDRLPSPIFNILVPGQTITSKLGREIAESAIGSLHFSALVTLGLILMIVVMAVTFAAHYLFIAEERLYE